MSWVPTRNVWLASSGLAVVAMIVFAQTIFASDGGHLPQLAETLLFGAGGLLVFRGLGHWDTLDGPAVMFARAALKYDNDEEENLARVNRRR